MIWHLGFHRNRNKRSFLILDLECTCASAKPSCTKSIDQACLVYLEVATLSLRQTDPLSTALSHC
jgi:hypothetical protein